MFSCFFCVIRSHSFETVRILSSTEYPRFLCLAPLLGKIDHNKVIKVRIVHCLLKGIASFFTIIIKQIYKEKKDIVMFIVKLRHT